MKTVNLTFQANIPPLPLKTVNIRVLTRTFPVLFTSVQYRFSVHFPVPHQYRQTTPSRVTFCTNASTAPVQSFGTGILLFTVQRQYRYLVQAQYHFLVPRQYQQTTPSRVKFQTNTITQPFSIRYYASKTPVPTSARRYWCGTKPVVNFHLGNVVGVYSTPSSQF